MEPRVVVVTRPTAYEALLASHGTHRQAEWTLQRLGQDIVPLHLAHQRQAAAVAAVGGAIPSGWRHARIGRGDLDRFLFEPEDLVVALGPDGLVANVAKYLRGQPVIGVNPDPEAIDGVLARHPAEATADLLTTAAGGRSRVERRTMVEARTDDGQRLRALNEIYLGHRSHQSSRYRIAIGSGEERQSSSGIIVASGTGCTGWALSIAQATSAPFRLPAPTEPQVVFFVREPWPSRTTGTRVRHGRLDGPLTVVSEMNEGGVLFGDGIEEDAVPFPYARRVVVGRAEEDLVLVV